VRPTALYADAEEAAELYAADVAGGHGAAVGAAAVPSVDDFMARLATVSDFTFSPLRLHMFHHPSSGVSALPALTPRARAAQAPKATDSEEPDDPTSSAWDAPRAAGRGARAGGGEEEEALFRAEEESG
jgi:hypothetical protein